MNTQPSSAPLYPTLVLSSQFTPDCSENRSNPSLKWSRLIGVACLLIVVAFHGFAARKAQANTIVFGASQEFSVATPPAGSPPWVKAVFDDNGGTGSVTLTLTALNLTGTEYVSEWDFNLDPALDPANLVFSAPTKTGTFTDPGIAKAADGFNADGGGAYDISLSFDTAAAGRFDAGESVKYTITGIASLDADSFNFNAASHGGNGVHLMATHVQSIGPDAKSGWVAPDPDDVAGGLIVPEPPSWMLAAFGGSIGLLTLFRRRKS